MRHKKAITVILVLLSVEYSCRKADEPLISHIVINELMPVNSTVVADQDGEYDDWFELYNMSSSSADISGYYVSDKSGNIFKWKIPDGTVISGNSYLIIWADEDSEQTGLHSNFKLSSLGEELLFSGPDGTLIDEIVYPEQTLELSFSRYPDGTGTFRWQEPTFNSPNIDSK